MTIHRKIDDERVKDILMESALIWIELHEAEHEHLQDETIGALASSQNGFLALAESSYYGAIRSVTWQPDTGLKPRGTALTSDDVMVGCPEDLTPSVYIHRDENGDVLYVGSTIHPRRRQMAHRRKSHWWGNVETITFQTYPSDLLMNRAEMFTIQELRPRHNITYNQWADR